MVGCFKIDMYIHCDYKYDCQTWNLSGVDYYWDVKSFLFCANESFCSVEAPMSFRIDTTKDNNDNLY